MTVAVQVSRVARRKLLDRCRSAIDATVVGYEASKAPADPARLHVALVDSDGHVAPTASTLASSSMRGSFTVHVFFRLPLSPESVDTNADEQVDPRMTDARDTLISEFHSNVTLGDAVELDPVGAYGDVLRWSPGYLDWDGHKFRTQSITVGWISFNTWAQARS